MAPDLAVARQPRDPASIRAVAHAIVSEPQFRTPAESPIDRARHWIGHEVGKILDSALSGHLSLIGAAVLVLLVALIVWLCVRVLSGAGRAPSASGPAVTDVRRSPVEWLREAAACEARDDWRGALRARYRALVAELSRRGLVDEIPGRTTGEYRMEVRASLPGAAGPFGGATDLFELAVYGHGDAGPREAAEIQALADRVLEGVR